MIYDMDSQKKIHKPNVRFRAFQEAELKFANFPRKSAFMQTGKTTT
jgi:hypothetical protein